MLSEHRSQILYWAFISVFRGLAFGGTIGVTITVPNFPIWTNIVYFSVLFRFVEH